MSTQDQDWWTQHIWEYYQVSPGPFWIFHAGFLYEVMSVLTYNLLFSLLFFTIFLPHPTPPTQILSNRTVNSFLLSIQVFGASSSISSGTLQYPIQLYFTPLMVCHITSHTYIPILIILKDKFNLYFELALNRVHKR